MPKMPISRLVQTSLDWSEENLQVWGERVFNCAWDQQREFLLRTFLRTYEEASQSSKKPELTSAPVTGEMEMLWEEVEALMLSDALSLPFVE